MRRAGRAVLALAVSLLAPAVALAAPQCRFDQAPTTVVFTGYTPFGPGVAATSTLHWDCPNPVTAAWIGISTPRVMTAGAETLQFELYQEAARTNVWREAPPVPVPAQRNGTATVYAFLPAPQNAAAGAYTATLTVRLYTDAIGTESDAASLLVQATVAPACTVNPATLAFGSYDPYGANAAAPLDAQAAIDIACTRNTPWTVGLGTGNNPLGAMRQMASGAQRLQYQLYSDSGRATVWDGIATVGGTATSVAPVSLPVYGRVPAGQIVIAGPYADAVTSTINF